MKKLESNQSIIAVLGMVFSTSYLFDFISTDTLFIIAFMVISTIFILEGFKQLILSITEKKK